MTCANEISCLSEYQNTDICNVVGKWVEYMTKKSHCLSSIPGFSRPLVQGLWILIQSLSFSFFVALYGALIFLFFFEEGAARVPPRSANSKMLNPNRENCVMEHRFRQGRDWENERERYEKVREGKNVCNGDATRMPLWFYTAFTQLPSIVSIRLFPRFKGMYPTEFIIGYFILMRVSITEG